MLQAIQDFQFTVFGGFAIYSIMCVAFVTIVGVIQISKSVINLIKRPQKI